MILVDTSVWIDFINHTTSESAHILRRLIESDAEICLADIHLTEILQGIKPEKTFIELKKYLLMFPVLRPQGIETYVFAAQISRLCSQKGNPMVKTVDTLIATIAIETGAELLHKDKDFDVIAKHLPLKIFKVPTTSANS
ncbi:MAG: PIN domain nuclease [Candidatus Omnitrophica bacterium]|nr:PIN domain nuclease [Candidatus Omnitrophota bacterium]